MDSHSIRLKRSVEKDLRGLPATASSRVLQQIERLGSNPFPHGARKLTSAEHLYRVRVGDYRIIYAVDSPSSSITIHYVRHRRDAYRNL